MLSFKQFLEEQPTDFAIDPANVPENLHKMVDEINRVLEKVTDRNFVNSAIFTNAVRGTLERYGILLPPEYAMPMLSSEAEVVYHLGDTGYYLYMIHDMDDGSIEGYACICDSSDLDDIYASGEEEEDEEDEEEDEGEEMKPWIPPARRDDDSGNTSEY